MINDIVVKVKELGEIQGCFVKTSNDNVYIKNAIIGKAKSTVVALLKIEKIYILSVNILETPTFTNFTDEQLFVVCSLGNSVYSEMANKILESRKSVILNVKSDDTQNKESMINTPNSPEMCKEAHPRSKVTDGKVSPEKKVSFKKNGKGGKEWDQFEANKKLFGLDANFDINEYAAPIDRTTPGYKSIYNASEKIASEINERTTSDLHRLEEREIMSGVNASDDSMYSTVGGVDRWEVPVIIKSESPLITRIERHKEKVHKPETNKQEKHKEETNKQEKHKEETNNHELNNHELNKEDDNCDEKKGFAWGDVIDHLNKCKKDSKSQNLSPTEETKPIQIQSKHLDGFRAKSPIDERKDSSVRIDIRSSSHSKESSTERDFYKSGNKSFKSALKFHKKYDSASADKKAPKKIIIGPTLKFNSAAECIQSLQAKFTLSDNKKWASGNLKLNEKVEDIKNMLGDVLLPSESRLEDILNRSVIFNKK